MANPIIQKLRIFILSHKIISGLVGVAVIVGSWYWYSIAATPSAVSRYVVQNATLGTVISSVSGSGQMQAATTVAVKPQTSETVTKVYVAVGQHVAQGQILVQLDTANEAKALSQAKISLQSAQLSLAKLEEAAATTTIQQDQDAITQAQESLIMASTTLARDYQSGFDSLSTAFVDFQNIMIALQNFVQGNDINKSQTDPDAYVSLLQNYMQTSALPYRDDIESSYSAAESAYQQNLLDYHAVNRNSSTSTLDSLFLETSATSQTIGDATKAVKDLLDYIVDNYKSSSSTNPLPPVTNTFQANFGTYTNTVNSDITNLANTVNTIASDKTSISNDTLLLNEKQQSVAQLQAGPDPLDIQSQDLSIQQAELNLQTAEQNLAYDSIRAPISGVVSAVAAVVGEDAPSPVVSIVGDNDIAEVTLNEVDAAKVSVGDKATLAFAALPNISVAGQVVEVDAVGTVNQGVVNYNVQIGLVGLNATTTQEIRPGMSVSANIVTQVDQNVVALPSSAVKASGGASYVLEPSTQLSAADITASQSGGIMLSGGTKMVPVTVGISDNTSVEIKSGVNPGDQVITQTIQSTSPAAGATAAPSGSSALRLLGGTGGGGRGAAIP
jgi:HlyD family secretion protein